MAYRASWIKSVQRGTITISGATSATATITSVDLTNAILRHTGQSYNAVTDNSDKVEGLLTFTNATTITASVNTSPGANTLTISFEVIEFWPGFIKSIQRGTITAGTATITSVNTAKAWVDNLGYTTSQASIFNNTTSRLVLTNATTVTASVSGATPVSGYQVVELK